MNKTVFAFVAFLLSLAIPATAQENPVVVELFTSQGCSSCPPADALMHDLAAREDVIPLALHVDYWDYIGWKDPFGNPAHADRQRAYAAAGNRRTIYTPEMVVGGVTDIVGTKPMALSKALAEHAQMPIKVQLRLERDGGVLNIDAKALARDIGPMTVQMLRYTPKQTTKIKRGENRGRTIRYTNALIAERKLATWRGGASAVVVKPSDLAIKGADRFALVVREPAGGAVLAARWLD